VNNVSFLQNCVTLLTGKGLPCNGLFNDNLSFKLMNEKNNIIKSSDTAKLQEVIIDNRTRIYISPDADPVEAKSRYIARFGYKTSATVIAPGTSEKVD
jgi:hypothetical protein